MSDKLVIKSMSNNVLLSRIMQFRMYSVTDTNLIIGMQIGWTHFAWVWIHLLWHIDMHDITGHENTVMFFPYCHFSFEITFKGTMPTSPTHSCWTNWSTHWIQPCKKSCALHIKSTGLCFWAKCKQDILFEFSLCEDIDIKLYTKVSNRI